MFSHHKAAILFEEGHRIRKENPFLAEEKFRAVTQMEPDNPWGWVYLLFAMEDGSKSLGDLIMVCSRLIRVSEKKPMHGIDVFAKIMMGIYLKMAEPTSLRVKIPIL